MEKILECIKKYDNIIIHGHSRPDGDCIGSQYGLMHLIKDNFPKKHVYVTGEMSDYVSFIGEPKIVGEELFSNALSICLDCGNAERLSDMRYKKSLYSIKIDHHVDSPKYCDYEYIDSTAASCTQIITEFYIRFKDNLVMSKEAATALYVGLLTDTGRFKYNSVNSKTFISASILLESGIDLAYIDNKLSMEEESILRLKGYCLSKFKITDYGFAYITLTKSEISKFGVDDESASSLVTSISTIKNCPIWALIIESDNGIRVRLRSREPKINQIASCFNGGGHKLAAGAILNSWEEVDILINEVNELLIEYNRM